MKTLKFILAITLFTILSSCSKSDDSSSTASIVGKWAIERDSSIDNGVESEVTPFEPNIFGCPKNYLEFTQDKVFNLGSYATGCVLSVATGSYTQDGKKIQIANGQFQVYEIETITATDLKIKFKNSAQAPAFTEYFYCKKI
jgi:hypothetical protein